ncbi:3-dehydroquinate synthase family protein [Amycolatopsis sp. DG1A-15b]|uniref:3-dehydroquinate synthase n=1 Tax=Amycolatopsis sp. DG1A-15b TaxID=3052846 RepID=UPI00255B9A29|nr:3-dehydroquinate synthase family protein [Amycolatopsis sp. DG1A-15b]WIX85827.1 3-dehydroquinate synthase family protein [Amycolatopsis sp. DG1A-15b]
MNLFRAESLLGDDPARSGGLPSSAVDADLQFCPGALASPPDWLDRFPEAKQLAVVTSREVAGRFVPAALDALKNAPVPVSVLWVPDGEKAKTLSVARRCYERLLSMRFARGDVLVSLGGGSVSDLAAFVASTWHRGTNVVHLPTTLLAQVDACIGGKTAINLGTARNVVGTFHEPGLVVIDTRVLGTLSRRDFASGMAEVVKCGFIADPRILGWVLDLTSRNDEWSAPEFEQCVRASLSVKARLVSGDREDRAQRMLLNYGHTVGQAIESASGLRLYRHGEAVGLGMIVAARTAELLGLARPGLTESTKHLLAALGLPLLVRGVSYADVASRIGLDKKTVGGRPVFVVVTEPGSSEVVHMPHPTVLQDAFTELLLPGGEHHD